MKLTKEQIIEIYYSSKSSKILEEEYKVSNSTILSIKRKKSHKNILKNVTDSPGYSSRRIPLSDEIIIDIFESSLTFKEYYEKYHISPQVVKNIKNRKSYKNITKNLKCGEIRKYGLTNSEREEIMTSDLPPRELIKKFKISYETVRVLKNKYWDF